MRETSNFSSEIMIPIIRIPLYWWGYIALISVKYDMHREDGTENLITVI